MCLTLHACKCVKFCLKIIGPQPQPFNKPWGTTISRFFRFGTLKKSSFDPGDSFGIDEISRTLNPTNVVTTFLRNIRCSVCGTRFVHPFRLPIPVRIPGSHGNKTNKNKHIGRTSTKTKYKQILQVFSESTYKRLGPAW